MQDVPQFNCDEPNTNLSTELARVKSLYFCAFKSRHDCGGHSSPFGTKFASSDRPYPSANSSISVGKVIFEFAVLTTNDVMRFAMAVCHMIKHDGMGVDNVHSLAGICRSSSAINTEHTVSYKSSDSVICGGCATNGNGCWCSDIPLVYGVFRIRKVHVAYNATTPNSTIVANPPTDLRRS